MEELAQLQQLIFKVQREVNNLKDRQAKIEKQMEKDVKEMRTEAEKVLEKASALVNPYSTKTSTWDKK